MTGFATKEGHPQKRKFLGFLSPAVGIRPCISPDFKMTRFLLRKLQMEVVHAIAETFEKGGVIRLILETRHKVIGKPVQIRFTPAVTPNPALEPDIQDIMEGDIGKEWGANRALRRPDLRGLNQS